MEKIKKCVIGGIIFYIEETGVNILENFIKENPLNTSGEKRELESEIAEILLSRLEKGPNYTRVVDIYYVKEKLGAFCRSTQAPRKPNTGETSHSRFFSPLSYFKMNLEFA